jgi:uncharacterized membrane protein
VKNLRQTIASGLVLLAPFIATAYVLVVGFHLLDTWIRWFGVSVPGVGAVVLIVAVYVTGLLGQGKFGSVLFGYIDGVIWYVPVVNWLYSTVKQSLQALIGRDQSVFRRPVAVRIGESCVIGFVTGPSPLGESMVSVLVLFAFSPGSGFLVNVPVDCISPIEMTGDEAFKYVLTAGMASNS